MLNIKLLRDKLRAERYSVRNFSSAMEISEPAMRRKLNGASEFKVREVDRAKQLLRLTDLELIQIFFADK